MKVFSIIIPVYNGHDVIWRALDSVYSSGLANEQFEVICVDDCSPTMDTLNALNSYTYNGTHPVNLKIYRHEVNKRQGGARNTGLLHAEAKWILYLDADDFFLNKSLLELLENIGRYDDLDIAMFDYRLMNKKSNKKVDIQYAIYSKTGLSSVKMSGVDFMKNYPVPYSPWCYAYRREFLLEHNIRFEENVSFEDTDYSIRSTVTAKNIVFLPIELYCYICVDGSTTTVKNDVAKVEDMFRCSSRVDDIARKGMLSGCPAAVTVKNHYIFLCKKILYRVLWRLSYHDITRLLKVYLSDNKTGERMVDFVIRHPQFYACSALILRPLLLFALWIKRKCRV